MTEPNQEVANLQPEAAIALPQIVESDCNIQSAYMSASSDDDDDSSRSYNDSRAESIADNECEIESLTGRQDTKITAKLRLLAIALFVSMAVSFPTVIYLETRENEIDNFEASFLSQAAKVVDSMQFQLAQKFGAVDSLRIAVTSYALSTNATWPFVTIPDYDLRGESIRDLGDVLSANFHPMVTLENREAWENYSVENIDWLYQAQARQGAASRALAEKVQMARKLAYPDFSLGFSRDIYGLNNTAEFGLSVDESIGPYLPTWQSMPALATTINFNTLSYPQSRDAAEKTMMSGDAVISRIESVNASGAEISNMLSSYYSFLLKDFVGDDAVFEGQPLATMYYPVFDTFETESRKLVGIFSTVIYFERFFAGVFPPDSANGVICVIENGCGDVFSFQINGEDVIYLGPDDIHDKTYDYIEQYYDFNWVGHRSKSFSYDEKTVRLNEEYCPYSLRVYPQDEIYSQHITKQPTVYAVSVGLMVMFISIVSLSYDYFIQRRMRRAVKSAKENRALVSSLFPANVRDRLLKEEEERKVRAGEFRPPRRTSLDSRRSTGNNSSRRSSNENGITDYFPFSTAMAGFTSFTNITALAPPKLRLKFFLNQDNSASVPHYPLESDQEDRNLESKPIADLFPNCTVLFADISGFTAWSSEREPEQVFTLLETIFQKFDHIARKRDIFKVETIGDCYVAVTGLPDPQPDHAVRMTKFARTCMQKVAEVTKDLEVTLGPGTGDLRMRFGLHSGPVTAGVLRGEKSRFQLFGDTVNTASRMESTGQRNRIQMSQPTAQLLMDAGKKNWIQARKDVVHAKGKGAIQTYWVLTRRQSPSVDGQSVSRPRFIQSTLQVSSELESVGSENGSVWGDEEYPDDSTGVLELPHVAMKRQSDILIDWLVDLMLRLLKQIVVGRDCTSSEQLLTPGELVASDCTVLEEVSESIELPKFDPKAARARARRSTVEVPEEVVCELRDYVRLIADRYR
jgi:class 3 adenylate cyclase